jgi:urease accessory protein
MPAPRTAMTMTADPIAEPTEIPGLYRLLAWLSPNFPTGAFSYSHGIEAAVADGAVHDRASLERWVTAIIAHGSGRIDADILCEAYRAAAAEDRAALDAANRRGVAFRATAELALESSQQGAAFARTCRHAWWAPASVETSRSSPSPSMGEGLGGGGNPAPPEAERSPPPQPSPIMGEGDDRVNAMVPSGREGETCHSAAFAAAAAQARIALEDALVGYLQAFAANLIAAGLRLGIIGQTDGQRILCALEPLVAAAANAAMSCDPATFGSATFAADLASMQHETQYTRLFRS